MSNHFLLITNLLHISIIGLLLYFTYSFYAKSEGVKRNRNKLRMQIKQVMKYKQSGFLKHLEIKQMNELLRSARLPKTINSTTVMIGYIFILIFIIFLSLFSNVTGVAIVTSGSAKLYMIILLALFPFPKLPMGFVLTFISKNHTQKINDEVYALYSQLSAEFYHGEKVNNTYHLLLEYREYFTYIKPAIERALSQWNGVGGSERAWDVFASEIGTEEAKMLAELMKEIENTTTDNALELISQRQEEFTSNRFNTFMGYLKDRETLVYVVIFICAMSVVAPAIVAQFLQFGDIANSVNDL